MISGYYGHHLGAEMVPEDRIKELDLLSGELHRQGRFDEAVATLEQVICLIESHRGRGHPSLGSPLNNLGVTYERLGRSENAEHAYLNALSAMAGFSRPFDIATTHHSLANLYLRTARLDEADEQLASARNTLAPVASNHPILAGFIEGRIAERLTRQKKLTEALPHLEASLWFLREAFAGPNEHVATAENNLAHALVQFDREDDAEKLLLASLDKMLALVAPEDARIWDTIHSLSRYYARNGRSREEAQLRELYVKLCAPKLPDTHPDQADMLIELGRAYHQSGAFGASEATYKRIISSDGEYAQNLSGLNGLANNYQAQGRYADAEALYRKALTTVRAQSKPDTINETVVLGNLADVLTLQGRTDEATRLLGLALATREKELGPDHLLVARTLHTMARVRISLDDMSEETAAILRRAIQIKERHLGPSNIDVAATVSLLATVLCNQERFQEASDAYLRMLTITQDVLGSGHPDVGMSYHNVGVFFTDARRFNDAEQFLRQSLVIFEHAHGPNHPEVALALNSLGNVLTKLGRKDEADRLYARADTIPGWETMEVPVIFATDRHVDEQGRFSAIQRIGRKQLGIGSVTVRVPKDMVLNRSSRVAEGLGFLDRAGGQQTQAATLRILRAESFTADSYLASIAHARLARATRYPGQGFLFVHGFNNSFEEAVQRAAMISFDLDFDGPAFVFSWSSHSKAWRYRSDRQRARRAVPFLVETLQRIGRLLPDMRLHILAHSTGCEIAVNALSELWKEREDASPPRLGELILAHADVKPRTLARTQPAITALEMGITSYLSKEDKAMSLSRWLRGQGERVGTNPVYLPDVDCIDLTGLGVRRDLNHNVFVRNPVVFGDIARLLSTGTRPPDARSPKFYMLKNNGGKHWVYKA